MPSASRGKYAVSVKRQVSRQHQEASKPQVSRVKRPLVATQEPSESFSKNCVSRASRGKCAVSVKRQVCHQRQEESLPSASGGKCAVSIKRPVTQQGQEPSDTTRTRSSPRSLTRPRLRSLQDQGRNIRKTEAERGGVQPAPQ